MAAKVEWGNVHGEHVSRDNVSSVSDSRLLGAGALPRPQQATHLRCGLIRGGDYPVGRVTGRSLS